MTIFLCTPEGLGKRSFEIIRNLSENRASVELTVCYNQLCVDG